MTGVPGSESRGRRHVGVCEIKGEKGTRTVKCVCLCAQEGYRLCVQVVKTVCLVLVLYFISELRDLMWQRGDL